MVVLRFMIKVFSNCSANIEESLAKHEAYDKRILRTGAAMHPANFVICLIITHAGRKSPGCAHPGLLITRRVSQKKFVDVDVW